MKVKVFDESHEKDLEDAINKFLEEKEVEIIDLKFSVGTAVYADEQIFCFSALLLYK